MYGNVNIGQSQTPQAYALSENERKLRQVVADFDFEKPKFYAPPVNHSASASAKKTSKTKPKQKQTKSAGKFSALLRVILWILLLVNVTWFSFYSCSKYINNEDLPMINGVGVVNMADNNMAPQINEWDLCIVEKQSNYFVDNTIAYVNENSNILVRSFYGKDSDGMCKAKGTASRNLETPFKPDQIKGLVTYIVPFVGFLILPAFNIGFAVLLIGCLILCYRWKAKRKHT